VPEAFLFLDRALGSRERLKAAVRDRLAALDRQTVRPGSESLLGAFEGGQIALQLLAMALIELVLIEVLSFKVARLPAIISFQRTFPHKSRQAALNPYPLLLKQLARSFWIHEQSLINGWPARVAPIKRRG
jgi:hypothetical protein